MHRLHHIYHIRVIAPLLLITAGVLASPSQAAGDRPGLAVTNPDVNLPVSRVETAAGRSAPVSAFDTAAWQSASLGRIDANVFGLALASAGSAVGRGETNPTTLTVIDFSQPSTDPRMWVYDLGSRELLFEEHVSHGRNSGHNVPTLFSNEPESNKSSLGLFRAAEGYYGKHGYSLRLDGLEKGINDRARERAIVIHGAAYVNATTAKAHGRLGRSLGCPAVRPEISRSLIDAIKDGGLLFAYYPDPAWLETSTYLN